MFDTKYYASCPQCPRPPRPDATGPVDPRNSEPKGRRPSIVKVPLAKEFRFVHEPWSPSGDSAFVGRDRDLSTFAERLRYSAGGAFLITGYRGVGKTSFVKRSIETLRENVTVLDLHLTLAKPFTPAQLMHYIIRGLYEQLSERGLFDRIDTEARSRLTLAYYRTSANLARKTTDKWENSISLSDVLKPLKLPGDIKIDTKRGRDITFEVTLLGYDDLAAERDVIAVSQSIAKGLYVRRSGFRGFVDRLLSKPRRRSEPTKIVFVFDEIDKLDDRPAEVGGSKSQLEDLLSSLKTLLTTSGICFIFIAGKDVEERWLKDLGRGDSIYESLFCYQRYLPCLLHDNNAIIDSLLPPDTRPLGAQSSYSDTILMAFRDYLDFMGRGIPRRLLAAFNQWVRWDDGAPILQFDQQQCRRLRFFSSLQLTLKEHLIALFGDARPFLPSAGYDTNWLGVCYLVDWIFERSERMFTEADLVAASRQLSQRIVVAEDIAFSVIASTLQVLVDKEFLEVVDRESADRDNSAAADDRGRTYRVAKRRLGELRGSPDDAATFDGGPIENDVPGGPEGGGDRLPQGYELLELLGHGEITEVWRTWDARAARFVAAKLLRSSHRNTKWAQDTVRAEADILSRLDHANIVPLIEFLADSLCILMKFLDGATVGWVVEQRGHVPVAYAIRICADVAEAVRYMHDQGIVHLDLKPGNVHIDLAGHVCLLDVGIAERMRHSGHDRSSFRGRGTQPYIAPEMAQSRGPVDMRADIYSFGVFAYVVLTGNLDKIEGLPASPSNVAHWLFEGRDDIPAELQRIILRCVEGDPAMRFENMNEIIRALESVPTSDSANDLSSLVQHAPVGGKRARRESLPITKIEWDDGEKDRVSGFARTTPPSPPLMSTPHPTLRLPTRHSALRRPTDQTGSGPRVVCARLKQIPGNGENDFGAVDLYDGRTTFGRAEDCTVHLSSPTISSYQAAIVCRSGRVFFTDLNSQNGSHVNGMLVTEVELHDADTLEIGPYKFQIAISGDPVVE